VWFSYRNVAEPADEDWVLRDVFVPNFTRPDLRNCRPHRRGQNNSHFLLLRFYDIQRGQILLDGVDIRFLDLQDLRRHFGIVLQDSVPLYRNYRVQHSPRHPWNHTEDVERAIDKIGLGDFVRTLEEGIATPTMSAARLFLLDNASSSISRERLHTIRAS